MLQCLLFLLYYFYSPVDTSSLVLVTMQVLRQDICPISKTDLKVSEHTWFREVGLLALRATPNVEE